MSGHYDSEQTTSSDPRKGSHGYFLPLYEIGRVPVKKTTAVRTIAVQGFGSVPDLEVLIEICCLLFTHFDLSI